MKIALLHITLLAAAVFFSCSSAPKRTGDIVILRTQAERDLSSGNGEAARGNFETALVLLTESNRKATLCDDWSLMIRSGISLGNMLFTLERTDEAFAQWDESISLAGKTSNRELLAISRIYRARGMLLSKKDSESNVLAEVNSEAVFLKDNLYIAFSWQVRGSALLEQRSFAEAENAFRRSLDIHLKERYLENASFDWYMIGYTRSLAGNVQGALQALEASITLDRRIENSWGLASSWRAIGDIHRRTGDTDKAREAYSHSRAIFEALGNRREVSAIDRRIN